MTDGKEKPGAGTPVVFLPRHIFSKLLKIAAFRGIPAQILGESELTKFVLKNWNRVENRPVRENPK